MAGWAPGPVGTVAKHLSHTGIRSPDHQVRDKSLYRLRYLGPLWVSASFKIYIRKSRLHRASKLQQVTFLISLHHETYTTMQQLTLVNDQIDAQFFILFYNTFITVLYMFRAKSCSSSGGQILLIQRLVSSLSISGRTVHRLRENKYNFIS